MYRQVMLSFANQVLQRITSAITATLAVPSKVDPVVGYSNLYGRPAPNDTVWHNQEWAFRMYGPLSQFTLFKAWYYDGEWHDPGELKGLQSW
jgi:hypothetical protein